VSEDLKTLPKDLPVPIDDGAANHLLGTIVPSVLLPSTVNRQVDLGAFSEERRVVVYCYPRTGKPGEEPLAGYAAWNRIPGARGCTPQSCAFRDFYGELQNLGAEVFGLSTQTTEYQQELVEREHLPFEILSDTELRFTNALQLPTFEVEGATLLKRLTFIASERKIIKSFLSRVSAG
jgi:peroxiredoxin